MSQRKTFLQDSLRRDDLTPPVELKRKRVLRMRWCVRLGDGSGWASRRLYSAPQARRFVRLAKRFGIDVYAAVFGKVWVEE
jgi:hypothetical protein